MKKVLYKAIAGKIVQYHNLKNFPNVSNDTLSQVIDDIHVLEKTFLLHGSGIDMGCKIDYENSNETKIIITFAYHHMDENGFYCGWSDYKLAVFASLFSDFTLKITGKNVHDIKDYLYQTFELVLRDEIDI